MSHAERIHWNQCFVENLVVMNARARLVDNIICAKQDRYDKEIWFLLNSRRQFFGHFTRQAEKSVQRRGNLRIYHLCCSFLSCR